MLRLYEFTVLRFYRLWVHDFTNLPFYGFTGKSVKCCDFTNLPFYGFTASGSTTLRIYRFTVLPPLAPRLYGFTFLRFYRLWLHNFTNLPFYGFTASGSTTLRIYRFTVLPPLAPHAQLHWCMTPLRIYHFTALPSSPVHAVHEKNIININLPLYGFTWVSFAFTSFTVHTSFTVLRFYGFTTFSCRFVSLSFRTLTMMFYSRRAAST